MAPFSFIRTRIGFLRRRKRKLPEVKKTSLGNSHKYNGRSSLRKITFTDGTSMIMESSTQVNETKFIGGKIRITNDHKERRNGVAELSYSVNPPFLTRAGLETGFHIWGVKEKGLSKSRRATPLILEEAIQIARFDSAKAVYLTAESRLVRIEAELRGFKRAVVNGKKVKNEHNGKPLYVLHL